MCGEPVFVHDSATDPRMTTEARKRFGPSMLLPLQSDGLLIGTLAHPRARGARRCSAPERLLAAQFAHQAALALVLTEARVSRPRPASSRTATVSPAICTIWSSNGCSRPG
jgi:GAF domain-containing protein